jgi:hypothetical protein
MVKLVNSWGDVSGKTTVASEVSGGEKLLEIKGVIFFEEKTVGFFRG